MLDVESFLPLGRVVHPFELVYVDMRICVPHCKFGLYNGSVPIDGDDFVGLSYGASQLPIGLSVELVCLHEDGSGFIRGVDKQHVGRYSLVGDQLNYVAYPELAGFLSDEVSVLVEGVVECPIGLLVLDESLVVLIALFEHGKQENQHQWCDI